MHTNKNPFRVWSKTPSAVHGKSQLLRPGPSNIFGIEVRGATETTPGRWVWSESIGGQRLGPSGCSKGFRRPGMEWSNWDSSGYCPTWLNKGRQRTTVIGGLKVAFSYPWPFSKNSMIMIFLVLQCSSWDYTYDFFLWSCVFLIIFPRLKPENVPSIYQSWRLTGLKRKSTRKTSEVSCQVPKRRTWFPQHDMSVAKPSVEWLVVSTYPSEKYEFVSWDHDIPNIWKIRFMFQTTNQWLLTMINHD